MPVIIKIIKINIFTFKYMAKVCENGTCLQRHWVLKVKFRCSVKK